MKKELMLRIVGIIFITLGALAVFGLDDPEFKRSLIETVMIGVGGIVLLLIGIATFLAGLSPETRKQFWDSGTYKNLR